MTDETAVQEPELEDEDLGDTEESDTTDEAEEADDPSDADGVRND